MTQLKLPLGVSDYKKIRNGNFFYVDKTLLIEELWETTGEVILMLRPRGFGKTVNASMLRYFFEKSDVSTDYLFTGTKIWTRSFYRNLQGQFPVITLNFKDCTETTYEKALENLVILIGNEFNRQRFLLDRVVMTELENTQVRVIRERKLSVVELIGSLRFLTELLFRASGRMCIVILDGYDTPLEAAYRNGYSELMNPTFQASVFEGNRYLERGFVLGTLETIFLSDRTQLFSLAYDDAADAFGFTLEEGDMLLEQAGLEAERDSIREWYSNYRCGSVSLYNPVSLLHCVSRYGICKCYWVNPTADGLIRKLLDSCDGVSDVETLLMGAIKEAFQFSCLENNLDCIWSLLFFAGYVICKEHRIVDGKGICELTLPNKEVRMLVQTFKKSYLSMKNQESTIRRQLL